MDFPERLIYNRFTKIDHRVFHEVAFTMKRIALLVVSILLFSFLAPLACAEKLDDSVLLSYYDDCVLFGDSRMEALKRYCSAVRQTDESFLRKTTIICTSSIGLYAASRNYLSGDFHYYFHGNDRTIYEIAKELSPKKAFVMLGLNDEIATKIDKGLSWAEKVITTMKEHSPDTVVYFFSETPVTPKFEKKIDFPGYQDKLDEYNALLKELCVSTGGGYIDIAEALKDENNYLLEEYSSDKICHISDEGLVIWLDRMKEYAQEQYDAGLWDPFDDAGESLPEGGNEP